MKILLNLNEFIEIGDYITLGQNPHILSTAKFYLEWKKKIIFFLNNFFHFKCLNIYYYYIIYFLYLTN